MRGSGSNRSHSRLSCSWVAHVTASDSVTDLAPSGTLRNHSRPHGLPPGSTSGVLAWSRTIATARAGDNDRSRTHIRIAATPMARRHAAGDGEKILLSVPSRAGELRAT